jgi:hypothetical protein
MDLTTKENHLIEQIYVTSINTLAGEDKELPQIALMLPFLKKE